MGLASSLRQLVMAQEEMATSSAKEGSGWTSGRISSLTDCQELEQAAQGSSRVTTSGSVKDTTAPGP